MEITNMDMSDINLGGEVYTIKGKNCLFSSACLIDYPDAVFLGIKISDTDIHIIKPIKNILMEYKVNKEKLMGNVHTEHHNKQDDGRSPEIEGYIDQTVEWFSKQMWKCTDESIIGKKVLDMGCDNGYMLYRMNNDYGYIAEGLDFFENKNIFNQKIHHLDMTKENLDVIFRAEALVKGDLSKPYDLITFNHTLEHVDKPHDAMKNAGMLGKYVFLGLPKAGTDWAYWDGHVSIWDERYAEHFMKIHGFEKVAEKNDICFRGTNIEFWGLYKNTKEF